MNCYLLTAIGGDISQSLARLLRTIDPTGRIIGADASARHAGSLFCDRYVEAPLAEAAHYGDWLQDILKTEQVDVCIPGSEAEQQWLHIHRSDFSVPAKLLMAKGQALDVGCDKLTTARFIAEQANCPAPWTVEAVEPFAAPQYPCIFKPRRGAGSAGVTICANSDEARQQAARYADGVLQELLLPADQEMTCGVFRASDGQVAVLPLLRQLVGGYTGWARVVDSPDATEQCIRIANALELVGAINIQLRLTNAGPRVFEINPRFSSTVEMRHLIGFRDFEWSLGDLLGKPFTITSPAAGLVAVKTQQVALLTAP